MASSLNLSKGHGRNPSTKNEKVIANLKWIIFPENKWIMRWDALIISLTWVLFFVTPFQIGVSFCYYLRVSLVWLSLFVTMNTIFFIDNFLYFVRPYRDGNGVLVLNLQKIRKNYFRTYCIPNFLSTLPTTLVFYLAGGSYQTYSDWKSTHGPFVGLLALLLPMLRFLRFIRLPSLIASSQFVKEFKERHNSQTMALVKYAMTLIVVSHMFACTWSFVALLESGMSVEEEPILTSANWISFWYNNSYAEGSLNPIGPSNSIDRYILSLFWSVQTITSIGYGNIMPYTRAEYFVGAALMLMSGICWAYIIGGLVGIAAGLGKRDDIYGTRLDQAGELIRDFVAKENESDHEYNSLKLECSKSIHSYIHTQTARSQQTASISTLIEAYPVLDSLPPELQRMSCLLVTRKYLEAIPYLSSKYLTVEEQSEVAVQCAFVEFPSRECVRPVQSVGRLGAGALIVVSGIAGFFNEKRKIYSFIGSGMPFGENDILLDNESNVAGDELRFLTFSRAVFIPKKAILDALKGSKAAWKGCARWRYLVSLMLSTTVAQYHRESSASSKNRQSSLQKTLKFH